MRTRLRCFGHVEHKDDAGMFKQCMTTVRDEIEGTLRKTCWDGVKQDMKGHEVLVSSNTMHRL